MSGDPTMRDALDRRPAEARVDDGTPSTPAGERSHSQPPPEVDSTRPPDPS